jgi:2-dehydropantoate 2-reductase
LTRHWYVLGAGAIGCLFAARLQQAGCRVTLVVRDRETIEPGTNGLSVQVTNGTGPGTFSLEATTRRDASQIDYLLITTKAYDARQALAEVAHRLGGDCPVVLMVNGMGLAEELQREHPQLALVAGTTTEGAYRTAPFQVHHAGAGVTHIGGWRGGPAPPWFGDWAAALSDCVWDHHIETALWRKLAINCAINPLTAIHGCRNGELGRRPELIRATTVLCEEIASVGQAAGLADRTGSLHQAVATVIAATAGNRSSMLQDIEAGRRTEITYITGYLLTLAGRHGIPVPANRELMAAVLALEAAQGR